MADKGPSISLCLIARDEERWLPGCLASALPWVDEVVLVDTGSSDRTVAMAQARGARVFHHPWAQDFALHRNQALDQARGDWVLWLDADEELEPASAPLIREVVSQPGIDSVYVEIIHLDPQGRHAMQVGQKLFRRASGLRFVGRIHERLVHPQGPRPGLRAPIRILHHGFAQGAQALEVKERRNLELLKAWIAQEPQRLDPRIYLAQTLMARPATAPACLAAAREALALARRLGTPAPHLARIYHPMLMALTHLDRPDQVIEAARQCLELLPGYPDPLFSLSWAAERQGDWPLVCQAARRFCQLQEAYAQDPVHYPYLENLSLNLVPDMLLRWLLAAARLDDQAQFQEVLERLARRQEGPELLARARESLRAAGLHQAARQAEAAF